MSAKPSRPRGRPKRPPIEAVRTIWWYWSVRNRSGLSESKLEAKFDDKDRKALGMHRSTRWNKYKFGRSNPSAELLAAVDAVYTGTKAAYDHDMWALASNPRLAISDLAFIAQRLPAAVRERFVADGMVTDRVFWLRQDTDFSKLCDELSVDRPFSMWIADTCAALLLVAQLSVHLQDENIHFAAYRGIARLAKWRLVERLAPASALLVAVLMQGWADMQYRDPTKIAVMESLKKLRRGPRPPWMPAQATLHLVESSEKRTADDLQLAKYYWAAVRLAA